MSERQADPCDDRIPLTVFRGWIIDQDAVHVFVGSIAAVVPSPAISNARYCEETWRDPLVLDLGGRMTVCVELRLVHCSVDWERTARSDLPDDLL